MRGPIVFPSTSPVAPSVHPWTSLQDPQVPLFRASVVLLSFDPDKNCALAPVALGRPAEAALARLAAKHMNCSLHRWSGFSIVVSLAPKGMCTTKARLAMSSGVHKLTAEHCIACK